VRYYWYLCSVSQPFNIFQYVAVIRDRAPRKGDDAILRALEEAVEIVGKNTQLLLEYYVTKQNKAGQICFQSCAVANLACVLLHCHAL
jgi:hypothetical protein